jgi:hypothetical protein
MNTGSKKLQREVGSTFCGAQLALDESGSVASLATDVGPHATCISQASLPMPGHEKAGIGPLG